MIRGAESALYLTGFALVAFLVGVGVAIGLAMVITALGITIIRTGS